MNMTINRKFSAISLALALAFLPCLSAAQTYRNGLVEKSVALVGNDVIMLSQIESEAQMMRARGLVVDQNSRCEILEEMLKSKLFATQAKLDSISVNEANVEAALDERMNDMITTLGGEKQAEEYFGKPLYKLRREWKEILTEQSMIQEMQRTITSGVSQLTPRDVKKYYDETPEEDLPMVSTQYRIRQIGLYPDKVSAILAVKEKLVGLRERVLNGEKFSTLARLYSQDPGSMAKGGELGMMSRSVFWPAFSDAAMSLKVGQVSQVVETPDGFHIIQLLERDGDMFNARHILIKPQYTSEDQSKAFRKLDSIRNLIVQDSISFYDAALRFSEEIQSATNGGLMADPYTGSSYFEKDQLKPADFSILRDMNVGDVSQPFESLDNEGRNGNTIYKILYLDKILPAHVANFKDDFNILLEEATNKKSMEAIDKFIEEKQRTTYIVIDPMFQTCEFKQSGWVK